MLVQEAGAAESPSSLSSQGVSSLNRGLSAIRATTAAIGSLPLLAVLVDVADEHLARAAIGSRPPWPPPLPQKRPIRVLAGEGEASVREAEEVFLLVVDEGGISPALLTALHLEVVEEPGVPLSLLGLGAFPEPSHAPIVRGSGTASIGDWRLVLPCINLPPIRVGEEP
jgi:hypothetical protein